MEKSVLSLLYTSCFGVPWSPENLLVLKANLKSTFKDTLPQLSFDVRERLQTLPWEDHWKALLEAQSKRGVSFSSCLCEDFPEAFLLHDYAPKFITYFGKPLWRYRTFLSVVGTRRPSPQVLKWMSLHLPKTLRSLDISVVSGGARGIDQWAHRLSMSAGKSTLAIVPCGLNNMYPDSLLPWIPEIVDSGGAVLSGYGLDQQMQVFYFHQRNRWIAQLGVSCFMVEAKIKSGSLLTARLASEIGKDVLTLPYSPWEGYGDGNIKLLKEGALIVADSYDLGFALAEFSPAKNRKS